jgi:hypothetical protein
MQHRNIVGVMECEVKLRWKFGGKSDDCQEAMTPFHL